MARAGPDPEGYYTILGVTPGAGADALKRAYHRQAKQLHPDHNPGPAAADAFQRLVEAYRVLADPQARARYDAGQPAQAPPPPAAPLTRCVCGKVSAQPRHVVFTRVSGRLWKTRVERRGRVFCSRCVEAAGLKASLHCWLFGWWSLGGPWATVKALFGNALGGTRPVAENRRLLLDQARAFLWRGRPELAHGLALQARRFAPDAESRKPVDGVLAALPQRAYPPVRDAWRRPGRGRWLHWLPVALLVAGLSVGVYPWARQTVGGLLAPDPPPPTAVPGGRLTVLSTGHLYALGGGRENGAGGRENGGRENGAVRLHISPDAGSVVVAELAPGSIVLLIDLLAGADGQAHWARVLGPEDSMGFIPTHALKPLPPGLRREVP
ncbi:J domain-containing protein [Roseospirillum parvum]|uniref:DnaJ domain-containing protein n=1 Tax=Roseospirillum parvum TaxID=83401 RepID=A0A1G8D3K6_9PROT|nr:J domain-containing protein [Roseospirillum parvum]SDH51750.1 DnaJ domain-containing protein [Roseospirillum parvum]